MALTIQERLKDLRVECGLTLEQLAEQTHLSKSALGSYEAEDFKDISHYTLSSGETQTESAALRRRSRTKARWRYPPVKADGRDAAEG